MADLTKMLELGKRIYNNKLIEKKDESGNTILSDEEAIKTLCAKVFTKNGEINSIEELRAFNALIVEVANTEAKGNYEQVINLVSDYKTVGRYDVVSYKIPKNSKVTMALSASASGVDFQKIPSRATKILAKPDQMQFGVQYSIEEMINDPVNAFRNAVNLVMEFKTKYIFNKIMAVTKVAKDAAKIPIGQISEVANIGFADFRKIENKLLRYGRGVKPIMIADRNFIDALALKQGTDPIVASGATYYLTDDLRNSLLRDTNIEQVSKTICIATDNPFTDDANSKVDLPVSEALVLAGGDKSPFMIREYGAMRTAQDMPSIEKEQVLMKCDFKLDVTLLLGQAISYIYDSSVTL
jgi:hypothetical protein